LIGFLRCTKDDSAAQNRRHCHIISRGIVPATYAFLMQYFRQQ